ncbi:MAG: glycosyltransferase [Sandaracinaceae bacterium]
MSLVWLCTFEAARLALRFMLLVLGVHFVRAAWTGLRESDPKRPPEPEAWPSVTVQLPVRNEFYVAERVLRRAAALDYPKNKLRLQVLDDSDDETTARVEGAAAELREQGFDVQVLHRDAPTGYKAGALNAGLQATDSELVAMFDADCVPGPDFLKRVVPYFQETRVGCVQVRWGFLNRGHSLLTRLQAMVLDGLFAIDQFARAARRLPLQFNGTNGMWRRETLDDVGGWRGEILAEDADLSFRAHLRGWRLVHLRRYAVPTELPEDMAAFRAQQHRWSLGSAQLLRSLGWQAAISPLALREKAMMFMHLGRHGIDPLIVMVAITSPLTTLYELPFLLDYTVTVNGGLLGLVGLGCMLFYGAALRYVGAPRTHWMLIPLVIPLAIGMSLTYSIAFATGLLRRGGRFVRTPKAGNEDAEGPRYRTRGSWWVVLEFLIAGGHAYFTVVAASRGLWVEAAFFLLFAASFGWVALATWASRGVGERGPDEA